jgi:hypothetical protein
MINKTNYNKTSYYDKDFLLLLGLNCDKKYKDDFIANRVRRHLYNSDLSNLNQEFFSLIYDLIKKKKNSNLYVIKTWQEFINNINSINNSDNDSSENVISDMSGNDMSDNEISDMSGNIINPQTGGALGSITENINVDLSENLTNLESENGYETGAGTESNINETFSSNYNLLSMESIYNILSKTVINNPNTKFESKYLVIFGYIIRMVTIFKCKRQPIYNMNYDNEGRYIKKICV